MRRPLRIATVAAVSALALASTGCRVGRTQVSSPAASGSPNSIRIASFNFPESEVLAEIYGQALRDHGYSVILQHDLGTRELVEPALERGLIDFVPEYAGTALEFVDGGSGLATADQRATHETLGRQMASRGIDVLDASPAQDQNGFAVTKTTAMADHLKTLGDLSPDAQGFVFGGPPECRDRPLCVAGLKEKYGLTFKSFLPLDDSGPLTFDALDAGAIDVGVVFTTDPHLQSGDYVLLKDELGLEPAENVTPIVRHEIVVREGKAFVDIVNTVSSKLTTQELVALNAAVAAGTSPESAARAWLIRQGLDDKAE